VNIRLARKNKKGESFLSAALAINIGWLQYRRWLTFVFFSVPAADRAAIYLIICLFCFSVTKTSFVSPSTADKLAM
jgi:hypothetical protein